MRSRPLLGLVAVVALWALLSVGGVIRPVFLPSPVDVSVALWGLAADGALLMHVVATLWRTVAAFAIAVIVGLVLGVPLGLFKPLYEAVQPSLDFFRSLPSPALIPLAMLILGIGDLSRISVAAFTCSLINAIQASYAIRSIPRRRIEAAQLLGARRMTLVWSVVIPSMLPILVAGWRITLSLALIVIVVTEMFIGTRSGLGYAIIDYHLLFRIPEMYGMILVLGLVGLALNRMVEWIAGRFVHWEGM